MTIPKIVNRGSVWPWPRFGDNLPFARHGQAAVALLEPKNILAVVRSLLSRSWSATLASVTQRSALSRRAFNGLSMLSGNLRSKEDPLMACARRVSSPMSGLVSWAPINVNAVVLTFCAAAA